MKVNFFLGVLLCIFLNSCSGCADTNDLSSSDPGEQEPSNDLNNDTDNTEDIVIAMRKSPGGVYEIPILVNGTNMYFIFDTGAGIVSISQTEANFLAKQGTLTQEDVRGELPFIDANGSVSIGTIINLKSVKLGNRELKNVTASVVGNNIAPLLLGQSVLSRFGKFTFDYEKGVVTFR